ncbi:MAG: diacylglycerol kinase [Treponema sp.]|jgi:diacylglycerol kinase family enzyme|nr:diacylglycerol kinase [Treponema sp.]
MNMENFGRLMAGICAHALAAPGRPLRWIIIANPIAGGFTIKSRWKRNYAALEDYAERARKLPSREDARPAATASAAAATAADAALGCYGLVLTTGPGHAARIAEAVLAEAASGDVAPAEAFYLIICAGGDGTSLDVQCALYAAGPAVREHCAVLRLPFGTGNDGADAWEIPGALDLLTRPSRIEKARALRLLTSTPGKGPFLAFNILSVGLDAFVTHMTNRMKGRLPGDSYKLWVDIASLLYDRIYKVGPLDIRLTGEGGEAKLRETALLLAVGASGRRTYGSHKLILPDDRNVCLVRQMPLLRKLALKDLFTTGRHADRPESLLCNASRVEFSGSYPILAQMDGETVLLKPEDFPAAIELSDAVIPVLKTFP